MSQTQSDTAARDPPAFDPATFDVPAFDEIETHDDLIDYSKAYFAVVVAHYDLDVEMSHVAGWEVSTRAKNRAACVKNVNLSKLGEFVASGFTDPDWDRLREEHNDRVRRSDTGLSDVRDVVINLTFEAFDAFDVAEWHGTIRHEAVHVEQCHRYGHSDHGSMFTQRAEAIDASTECPKFVDYKYPFACRECGESTGGRHRESKAVRFARKSWDEQCKWVDAGKKYWKSNCCDAFLTLAK